MNITIHYWKICFYLTALCGAANKIEAANTTEWNQSIHRHQLLTLKLVTWSRRTGAWSIGGGGRHLGRPITVNLGRRSTMGPNSSSALLVCICKEFLLGSLFYLGRMGFDRGRCVPFKGVQFQKQKRGLLRTVVISMHPADSVPIGQHKLTPAIGALSLN